MLLVGNPESGQVAALALPGLDVLWSTKEDVGFGSSITYIADTNSDSHPEVAVGNPGKGLIRILDGRNGSPLMLLEAPVDARGFGYSSAWIESADLLLVGAPAFAIKAPGAVFSVGRDEAGRWSPPRLFARPASSVAFSEGGILKLPGRKGPMPGVAIAAMNSVYLKPPDGELGAMTSSLPGTPRIRRVVPSQIHIDSPGGAVVCFQRGTVPTFLNVDSTSSEHSEFQVGAVAELFGRFPELESEYGLGWQVAVCPPPGPPGLIAVSAPGPYRTNPGAPFTIVYPPPSSAAERGAVLLLSLNDEVQSWQAYGPEGHQDFGMNILWVIDLDEDGVSELVVRSNLQEPRRSQSISVHVLSGATGKVLWEKTL